MKLKFKILTTTFVLFLLFFNLICFATDANYETMLISDTTNYQQPATIDSDLYIADSEYEINNTVNGSVFASVDTLNVNASGIINGNLFVTADNVNIKSDIVYSDTEKDELGNPAITINKSSYIQGNVFILTDKFVLNPGCEIKGDLYICATEVHLEQNSKIDGNVFIASNSLSLNGMISGNLYANVKSFDMQYFGFIDRDLLLNTGNANINGYINRNSFIEATTVTTQDKFINKGNFTVEDANILTFSGEISGDTTIKAKNITTTDKFINQKDFNIINADTLTFSGEVRGNATINAKNITFKYLEDITKPIGENNNKPITCKIHGNLNYSSQNDIRIIENAVVLIEGYIVLGELNKSDYVSPSTQNMFSNIFDYVLNLVNLLILVYIIYALIHKFAPKYLDKTSNITGLNLLKYLGIGLGFLILIPTISILLLISNVGSILGIILLLIYIILLLIAKPMFIISIATFAKNKCTKKLNIYLYILGITVILSLIYLIPYIGFIVSILVNLSGFGMITKSLIPSKK